MQGKSEREVKVLKQGVKVPKLARKTVRVKAPSERKSIAGKRSGGTRRPLVDMPELDGVAHNRKINLGDRAFLALYEIRLIGQSDFVSGRRGESGGSHSLPRVSLCLGPYPPTATMDTSRTNSRIAALRERDKRSETFREILNGDACHTHLICNAHAQPPDDAGPSVPAPRFGNAIACRARTGLRPLERSISATASPHHPLLLRHHPRRRP